MDELPVPKALPSTFKLGTVQLVKCLPNVFENGGFGCLRNQLPPAKLEANPVLVVGNMLPESLSSLWKPT